MKVKESQLKNAMSGLGSVPMTESRVVSLPNGSSVPHNAVEVADTEREHDWRPDTIPSPVVLHGFGSGTGTTTIAPIVETTNDDINNNDINNNDNGENNTGVN